MNVVEVVACQSGMARHAPGLAAQVVASGGVFATIECFDKCETCERVLLVRVAGVMMRCADVDELTAAIMALGEA